MNEGSDSVRISLRLADGDLFPVFRYGDPEKRRLSLVPARAGQDEADIHFFHHTGTGSEPSEVGTLHFPNLPPDENLELNLVARIGSPGLLSVTLTHADSGRFESADLSIPDETAFSTGGSSAPLRRGIPARWILGVLFFILSLGLIFLATYAFTEWGLRGPEPAPLSLGETRLQVEIT